MTQGITFQTKIRFELSGHGRKRLAPGTQKVRPEEIGRVPRIARLMALAIRFDGLIRGGTVTDQADLARLGQVTRARITQIMNLLHLAPEIQEALLFLPRITSGRDRLHLRLMQPIAQKADWRKQRKMWKELETAQRS
jgi:hypothetical protein